MIALLTFPFIYARDVLLGGIRVAHDVLSPRPNLHPTILRIPVSLTSKNKRFVLANMISMTPGTISVAEEDDGRTLIVHSLYGGLNPDEVISDIQKRYEGFLAKLP